ncbi:erythromycin esterase family protein [Fibrisoma limi]|nr:erythromycin esterase family protein [Fibrisoma limi]
MNRHPFYIISWAADGLAPGREETIESLGDDQLINTLQKGTVPLELEGDLDSLLNDIGDSRYVLLGEASHGTAEFYAWRAAITRRLIAEKGFTFVAVEGDWPDAYVLNSYVQGLGSPGRATEVLQAFNRWPTWMWANAEIARLAEWMRTYNDQHPDRKASFYGLDVYSLWESLNVLATTLRPTDPETAQMARNALACFDGYRGDEQAYALATLRGIRCADALDQLRQRVQARYSNQKDTATFNVLQNAITAVNAEQYYYEMVRDDAESWNIRDRHMATTLDRLMKLHGPNAKAIVWAHNTHVGDARYTDMAPYGMVNLGQLVRESHGSEGVYIVGFGTYQGEVIAADRWGNPLRRMPVPQSPTGSWDELLHRVTPGNKLLFLNQLRTDSTLAQTRGQRAIGVVYHPNQEQGNYVPTRLTERYDGLIFLNRTQALQPIDVQPQARKEHSEAPVGQYALIND